MRICGGIFGGRTFYPPANNWPTRPTTEIARQALFNILDNIIDFSDSSALDLFGGTGAHTYEMVSRGCKKVTYVDKFKPATLFVKKVLEQLDSENSVKVVLSDYKQFVLTDPGKYDYIFAGPPYPLKEIPLIPDLIFDANKLMENGLFVLEHHQAHQFQSHEFFAQCRNYGQTHFSFFKRNI